MDYINKFRKILNKKEKTKFIILFVLSLFGAILELFGISLIFPLFDLLVNPNNIENYKFLLKLGLIDESKLYNKNIIILLLIFISFVFVLRSFFLIFLSIIQNTFVVQIRSRITYEIYNKNILNNFLFFNSRDNSEILKNIISEAGQFIKGVFNQILILLLEISLFFGLLIILFNVNYQITIFIVFIFCSIGIAYLIYIKKKIRYLGNERNKSQTNLLKNLYNSVKNFIDIRIFEKEIIFSKNFLDSLNLLLNNLKNLAIVQSATRYIFELLIIIILISSVGFFYEHLDKFYTEILFSMVLIVRVYPVFNKIISCLNTIIYSKESINNVYDQVTKDDIKLKDENYISNINSIYLENVSFKFFKINENIVDNLSIKFEKNKSYGIFGTSGSGKTTLLNILSGLIEPNSGSILINEKKVDYSKINWRKKVSYVSQNPFFVNDTINYNITFKNNINEIEKSRIDNVIETSKLKNFIKDNMLEANYKIGEDGSKLSGGQRQRVGIARAIYKNADLYIFDEATSGIDSNTETNLIKDIKLKYSDKILIFISHNKNVIDLCDETFELKNKKLERK